MKITKIWLSFIVIGIVGCQTTNVKQATFSSDTETKSSGKEFIYSPNGKEQFVFGEKAETLRKYGYDKFCPDTTTFACLNRLPHEKYVGMKGYFETDTPTKTHYAGYEFYPVVLENGDKFYYVASTKLGGKYGTLAPIISLEQHKEVSSFVQEPLVSGSDINLVSNEVSFGTRLYKLSNGVTISEEGLSLIREVSNKFHNNPKIASLLLGMSIDKDEVENRYFISPKGSSLRSEVKLYIGLNEDKTWLRYKVKYYDDDWLFVSSYKVAADDYRWQSPKIDFKRDHSSGDVWEWIDTSVNSQEIEISKKLGSAKKSIIRFQGSKYYSDKELEAGQKKSLLDILELYSLMNGA